MDPKYDITLGEYGRVIVILHPGCAIPKEEILALLGEAGIDPANVEFINLNDAAELTSLNGCPVVIPLDAETCDEQELEAAALSASGCGGRVVAVFGPELTYTEIHPIAEKYGSQCGWSPKDLASVLKGDTDVVDSAGVNVARKKPRQVDCN